MKRGREPMMSNYTRALVVVACIVAGAGGYWLGSRGTTNKAPCAEARPAPKVQLQKTCREDGTALGPGDPRSGRTRVLVDHGDPAIGPADALVTIVEFSDFACPHCREAAGVLRRVQQAYPKDVRVVFKQRPLSMHEHAFLAAEAALAAHEQGRFWEMHDALFAEQDRLDRQSLEKRAGHAGLSLPAFVAALDRHAFRERVDADLRAAERLGVMTTPTYFLNGRRVEGAQPFDDVRAAVDAELAYARAVMARGGIARDAVYREIMKEASEAPAAEVVAGVADPRAIYRVPVGSSPTRGPAGAKLTIVLFSDSGCEPCAALEPVLSELRERYPGELRIVQKSPRVAADAELARRVGAVGIPFLFINGRPVRGVQTLEALARICDEELARADARLAAGVARERLYDALTDQGLDEVAGHTPQPPPAATATDELATGPADAKVAVVFFFDYECPTCQPIAAALERLANERVRVVYRHLSPPGHVYAPLAAEAALAAQAQGKWPAMHARLLANPKKLDRASLYAHAKAIGLDMKQFRAELESGTHKGRVDSDAALGRKMGVSAGPALFVNGRSVPDPDPGAIDAAIQAALR